VAPEEWAVLGAARLDLPCCSLPADQRAAAATLLAAAPAGCQLSLLRDGIWLLKPSLNGGGNGRGILLLDRLPAGAAAAPCDPAAPGRLLAWAAAVGRAGSGGLNDARHGCVLQKAVERPHLLDRARLLRCWPNGQPRPEEVGTGPQEEEEEEGGEEAPQLFKYNWRLWMLGSLAPAPAAWLHREGYADLAGCEFTRRLLPGAHVTNQLRGHAERGRGAFQRQWDVRALGQYLSAAATPAAAAYEAVLLPQARAIIRAVFAALSAAGSLCPVGGMGGGLKRYGIDLLVDEGLTVWLVEANVLKGRPAGYGLGAAGGPGGGMKAAMVGRLVDDEDALKAAIKAERRGHGGGGGAEPAPELNGGGCAAAFVQLLD
jgi:hypothetical protein